MVTGPASRADAARNREAILAAAESLFDDSSSWDAVSMSAVAAAAKVGKGTVFRAFKDRAGLLRALMGRRSGDLIGAVEAGQRPFDTDDGRVLVAALLDALLTLKFANRQLSLALDRVDSASPYQAENYGWWHATIANGMIDLVGRDADHLAHALLAAVRSDLIEHLLVSESWTESDIRAGVADLVARVLA